MPHKLLLADDSVTIQRVIELTFADEDVKVEAVGDGQQAIDRIEADPPDIVLADVGMPGRDGYEVAGYVKERPALSHIPVLLLTGAFEQVDEVRAREVRCDGVLAKPFEPQLLIAKVRELLGPGRETGEAEAPRAAAEVPEERDTSDDTGPIPLPPVIVEEDGALDPRELLDGAPPRSQDAEMSLDDYFDRLDQAFASLTGSSGSKPAATTASADRSWAPAPPPASSWPSVEDGEVAAPAQPAPPAAAQARQPVSVAEAFAALLDAEATVDRPGAPPAPAVVVSVPAPSPEVVEDIVRRVIDRLGDRHLRELIAELILPTAERLVREEIDRIKTAS